METKPVASSHLPAYPTRREVLAGAAGFFLAIKVCGGEDISAADRTAAQSPTPPAKPAVQRDSKAATVVAPIFEHGEGRGATGCVVISPPVFLSEEEALQILKEELGKHGVQLVAGPVVKEWTIAPRGYQQVKDDEKTRTVAQDVKHAAPLRLTGLDERKAVAVEFVSIKGYNRLGGVDSERTRLLDRNGDWVGFMGSTVSSYDFKDAAKYLAGEIRQKGHKRLYVGVFYEPASRKPLRQAPDKQTTEEKLAALKAAREASKTNAESKSDLRRQAQDFVAWLKEQKAL